ncbi:MAG: lantibiotic protection ABC transporter ATP-binding protein [Acetivibrio sp.]
MDTILTTKNLCKNFKKQKANDNISITVRKNSIYGLLGPNGAGKSTFLKMIAGMITPSSGEIYFDEKVWERKHLIKIGAFIESPPIYENLTAFENLKVRALLYNLPNNRIEEVLQIVNLTNTGKKKSGQFSMGMKQRLGIAMALLNNPTLLILDEPTNGLDPIGIQDLRELILSFSEKDITVILSSHILSEVEQIADDIGIIADGRLWYEDKIHKNEDLESLFMEVVRKSGAYHG